MTVRHVFAAAVAIIAVTIGSPASGNGRFPYANQLVVGSRDPNEVVLRTTFGLLVSHDGGHHFNWVCEQINGFVDGNEPGVALFDDGAVAVAGQSGLAISRDRGCSFAVVGGDLQSQSVVDVSVEKTNTSHGIAVTRTPLGNGEFNIEVVRSMDNGVTWASAAPKLPRDLTIVTIDVAPSDTNRLYVSGSVITTGPSGTARNGVVLTSANGGATWTSTAVPEVPILYIAAIDPTDPLRVYVRSFMGGRYLDAGYPDGSYPDDVLYVAADGVTFVPVATFNHTLSGLAVSPDGLRVAAGGPQGGLFVADRTVNPADMRFELQSSEPTLCLTWTPDYLYSCGSAEKGHYVLARSKDEGENFEVLVPTLQDIQPPIDTCPPGSPLNAVCFQDWCREGNVLCNPYRPIDEKGRLLDATLPPSCTLPAYCPVFDAGPLGEPSGEPASGAENIDCGCRVPGGRPWSRTSLAMSIAALFVSVGAFARRVRARRRRE